MCISIIVRFKCFVWCSLIYFNMLTCFQGETEAALNGIEMLVANHFTLCQNDCLSPDIDVLFL